MPTPLIRDGKLAVAPVKGIDKLNFTQKARLLELTNKKDLTGADARELIELRKAASK